jgi:hypothetical protein
MVYKDELKLKYVESALNIAGIFTKPLSGFEFRRIMRMMSMKQKPLDRAHEERVKLTPVACFALESCPLSYEADAIRPGRMLKCEVTGGARTDSRVLPVYRHAARSWWVHNAHDGSVEFLLLNTFIPTNSTSHFIITFNDLCH